MEMNVLDLFAEFDALIINRLAEISSVLDHQKAKRRNFYLKDLLFDSKGNFLPHLNSFLCWLIEDIERENYFSKQCNIRFTNVQEDTAELIKVSLSQSSRCTVHIMKHCEQWVRDCEIAWIRHRKVVQQKFMSITTSAPIQNKSVQLLSTRYSSISPNANNLLSNRSLESKRLHYNYESSKLEYSESMDYLVLSEVLKSNFLLPSIEDQSDDREQSDSDSGSVIQSCVHPVLSHTVDFAKPSASGCQLECSSTVEETNPSTSNSVLDSTTERDDGSITKGRTDNRPRSLRAPQEKNCVTVKLSTLPTDTSRLCQIFKIKHASIFCGEFLEKKFGGEFLFKKRFIWCDPSTRSIVWAKSAEMRQKTPAACKFVLLKRFLSRKSVSAGQCRGIVHDISFNEQGFNILTESGTLMTIKLPSGAQPCWQRLLMILHS